MFGLHVQKQEAGTGVRRRRGNLLLLLTVLLLFFCAGGGAVSASQVVTRTDHTTMNLLAGTYAPLTAALNTQAAGEGQVTSGLVWSSSDSRVAEIRGREVYAKAPGSADLYGQARGATVSVIRLNVAQGGIELNTTSLKLKKGKKFKLLAESSGKKLWVSWSSSNPRVATVDKTGKIKAKRPGKATITASAGGKRAVCKVRVTKSSGNKVTRNFRLLSDGSTAFRIQMNTSYLQIQKGRKYRFYACRTAGNQKKVRASFKSSNPKVVSVSRWGGMIKAKKKGSAYITATFQNMTCRCRVIVKKKTNLVETVNFRMVAGGKAGKLQTSAFRIRTGRGQSFSLRAAVDTTLLGAWQVRWASSDPSVATVGGDGVIHTVGTGSCVITAAWNGLKASTSVTVDQKVARMTDVAERFGVDGAGRYRAGGGGTSYRRYPTVLLAGASTLDYWDTAKDAFPGCRVVNTAVSGTNLQYLQDRLSQNVLSYHPDAVVLFHGQNDIRNQTTPDLGMGKDVGQRVAAQLESIHQGLPGTPVWYVSLLHVPKKKDAGPEIDEANRIIKDYCDRTPDVYWIDLSPYFWNRQNGQYALTLFKDSIHPNRSGYEVWKNIVGIPVSNALYSWT